MIDDRLIPILEERLTELHERHSWVHIRERFLRSNLLISVAQCRDIDDGYYGERETPEWLQELTAKTWLGRQSRREQSLYELGARLFSRSANEKREEGAVVS